MRRTCVKQKDWSWLKRYTADDQKWWPGKNIKKVTIIDASNLIGCYQKSGISYLVFLSYFWQWTFEEKRDLHVTICISSVSFTMTDIYEEKVLSWHNNLSYQQDITALYGNGFWRKWERSIQYSFSFLVSGDCLFYSNRYFVISFCDYRK